MHIKCFATSLAKHIIFIPCERSVIIVHTAAAAVCVQLPWKWAFCFIHQVMFQLEPRQKNRNNNPPTGRYQMGWKLQLPFDPRLCFLSSVNWSESEERSGLVQRNYRSAGGMRQESMLLSLLTTFFARISLEVWCGPLTPSALPSPDEAGLEAPHGFTSFRINVRSRKYSD